MYVACDVSNLWKSCREQFGDGARVDFQVLGALVPALRHPAPVQQKLVAYVVTNPRQKHHQFSSVLHSFGYEVRERFMRHDKSLLKPMHTDWDVGITIDAMDRLDDYDTFALMSGDGDFALLLEHLRQRGKKTMVLTFEKATSRLLYANADEVVPLSNNVVFNQEQTR